MTSDLAETLRAMREALHWEPDVMSEATALEMKAKAAFSSLTPADQTILMLYMELGSLSAVGDLLGVAKSTAFRHIDRIRASLKEHIAKLNDKDFV